MSIMQFAIKIRDSKDWLESFEEWADELEFLYGSEDPHGIIDFFLEITSHGRDYAIASLLALDASLKEIYACGAPLG